VDARAAAAREEIQGANDGARDLRAAVLERDRLALRALTIGATGDLASALPEETGRIEVLVTGLAGHPGADESAVASIGEAEAVARTAYDQVGATITSGEAAAALTTYDTGAEAATVELLPMSRG
jgi:hypothetical protein